jgi:uncharacterized repeat protein (TIGR03803 family)
MSGTKTFHLLLVLALLTTAGVLSQAQNNFTVLHSFTGPDGARPASAPALDGYGNLYGTTVYGGGYGGGFGYGVVYELANVHGSWIPHQLHYFMGSDGAYPYPGVTIGPDGTLFGTTYSGGENDAGVLFNVKPPAHACAATICPWTDITLHSFSYLGSDGAAPLSNIVFDPEGNLYGTTQYGGLYGVGTVYKATLSGGTWNESVLYSFGGYEGDGAYPVGRVVLDSAGNIYGITTNGGSYGYGTVFELSPSEGGWTETLLYSFEWGYGCGPSAGLVFDGMGNLYGGTAAGPVGQCATIFELSPQQGGWNFRTIYMFINGSGGTSEPDSLAIDAAGNLYVTSIFSGLYGDGSVFELSPTSYGWVYTDLYDFTGGNDGLYPVGVAVTGPSGYLYGTTEAGGNYSGPCALLGGCGVVIEVDASGRETELIERQ